MRKVRGRIYQISPSILPHAFRTGSVVEIIEGIPEDAQFRGYTIDPMSNTLQVFVEHESFEETPENCVFPIHQIKARTVEGSALRVYRRMTEDGPL